VKRLQNAVNICYNENGDLPRLGVILLLEKIVTLVVAPLLVGLVIELVSHWLAEKDDN
jgi:hypothetical protein